MILHFSEILLFSTPSHRTIFLTFISLVSTPLYFLDWPLFFFFLPPAFFFFFFFPLLLLSPWCIHHPGTGRTRKPLHKVSFKTLRAAEQASQLHQRSKQTPQGFCFFPPLPLPPSPFFFFPPPVFVCYSFAGSGGPERKTQTLYFEICGYFSSCSQSAAFNILPGPPVGFQGKDLLPLLLPALLPVSRSLVRSFHPRALRPSAPPGPLSGAEEALLSPARRAGGPVYVVPWALRGTPGE